MKFVTFLNADGRSRPGLIFPENNEILDLHAAISRTHSASDLPESSDINAWIDLDWPPSALISDLQRHVLNEPDLSTDLRTQGALFPRDDVRLLAPVPAPGKIVCVGLNYRDHAIESGMAIPERPLLFSKFPSSVIASRETIVIPDGSHEVDYEAELAVVIGRKAKKVGRDDAFDYVFGYTNFNDVSARDWQFADGQWQRGKSADTFAPMGEHIATTDEIVDPHTLSIKLFLNGRSMQDSSTEQLIFDIPQLVEFISASITLEPGDIIATGTPPGVGFARKPPIFLSDGDEVVVEIEGLGRLANTVGCGR